MAEAQSKQLVLTLVRYRRMIEAYAYAITPDFHQVEDVFQEVASVVVEHQDALPADDGQLAAWLREVTRRKALEIRRKAWRMPRPLADDVLEVVGASCTDGNEDEDETAARRTHLLRCLDGLSDRAREVIEARYQAALDCPEIAKRFGLSVHSVYAILKRAKLALHHCLEHHLPETGGGV